MFAAVYTSRAEPPMTPQALESLLVQCRSRNAQSGVTGLLLYRDGQIIQLLEGSEPVVRALLTRIEVDTRHRDMSVLWSDDYLERLFPDWSMGFRDLASEPAGLDGYTDLMSRPATVDDVLQSRTTGQELLALFRRLR
jgi:hypothetical protein